MAKTIDEAFNTFHGWLTPTGTESDKAKSHRASIEACLKDKFELKRFFRTGSFGNGTSISSYSDVDYFASIPNSRLKNDSSLTLKELKNILDARFPNTGVHIDTPAVVVPFGDSRSETTEIVPCDFVKRENECTTYDIPNQTSGWMRANPELHNAYVSLVNNKDGLNKKVKPLIRFIKAWKYYNNVPIASFYLEIFVANYAYKESSIFYSIDIKAIFELLKSSGLRDISDPMGVSGSITACKSFSDKTKALEKLDDAVRRSNNARNAESNKDTERAIYWWNKVYNDLFPGYY